MNLNQNAVNNYLLPTFLIKLFSKNYWLSCDVRNYLTLPKENIYKPSNF